MLYIALNILCDNKCVCMCAYLPVCLSVCICLYASVIIKPTNKQNSVKNPKPLGFYFCQGRCKDLTNGKLKFDSNNNDAKSNYGNSSSNNKQYNYDNIMMMIIMVMTVITKKL